MDKTIDISKFQEPTYKRQHGEGFEVTAMTGDDIGDLLQLAVDTARQRGVCRYENSERGLQAFMERSIEYLQFILRQNEKADAEGTKRLIPSIESWAVYLGCSRMTILTYSKQRGEDWESFIAWQKNVIQSARSQLTDLGRIPVLSYIFSSVNGHQGYANTSEIRLSAIPEHEETATTESPSVLAERYRAKLTDSSNTATTAESFSDTAERYKAMLDSSGDVSAVKP